MARPVDTNAAPTNGPVAAIKDEPVSRAQWLILVGCVGYLVVVGWQFNK